MAKKPTGTRTYVVETKKSGSRTYRVGLDGKARIAGWNGKTPRRKK